jgi:hypothetical protein
VLLRDLGQRCLGVVCMTCSNRYISRHRTTSSGTPPRSNLISPPRTPPTRRQPDLSLSLAVGKWSTAAVERRHLASPSKVPRRTPTVARRSESGALNGLQSRPTTTTMTTRKRMTLIRSMSWPPGAVPGADTKRPLRETPRGGQSKLCIPHQAQAKGLQYGKKLQDLGVPHPCQ